MGFFDSKGWSLVGQDPGFKFVRFDGQFITENYREGGGDIILGENSSLNREAPNFQYLSGQGQFSSFTTRLFRQDFLESIKQDVEDLKSFKKRDPDLKRPPIFLFTNGSEIEYTCFVKKVDFEYDEISSDGFLKGAIVSIVLQILEDFGLGLTNASTSLASQIKTGIGIVAGVAGLTALTKNKINVPGGSLHTIDRTIKAKQGNTFESIARKEYGNPLAGDILRRAQPDKATLKPGDEVILLDPTEVNEIQVTQQSVALKDTQENLNLREQKLEARNRTTTVFV